MRCADTGIIATANDATGAGFLDLLARSVRDHKQRSVDWTRELRARGVKAAHPDDGWVNREDDEVHFAYPLFNDGVQVGDLVALGDHGKHRIVRVTYVRETPLGLTWYGLEKVAVHHGDFDHTPRCTTGACRG